jgi:hypothetical protein
MNGPMLCMILIAKTGKSEVSAVILSEVVLLRENTGDNGAIQSSSSLRMASD